MQLRRLHRLLGLLICVPSLLWGISGALLAWKNWASEPEPPAAAASTPRPFKVDVGAALATAAVGHSEPPQAVEWRHVLGAPRYLIRYAAPPAILVDGESGQLIAGIDEASARKIAAEAAPAGITVADCELQTAPSLVYLDDFELPVYRVGLSDRSNVYLSPRTGEVFFRAPRLAWLIRFAFYKLHVWKWSGGAGRAHSYLLLLAMALVLAASSATGLWLLVRPLRRAENRQKLPDPAGS